MGLAAGLITFEEVLAIEPELAAVESFNATDDAALADLIREFGGQYITADGVNTIDGQADVSGRRDPFAANETVSADTNEFVIERRPDIVLDGAPDVVVNPDATFLSSEATVQESSPLFLGGVAPDELDEFLVVDGSDDGSGDVSETTPITGPDSSFPTGPSVPEPTSGPAPAAAPVPVEDPDQVLERSITALEDRDVFVLASELLAEQPDFTPEWVFQGIVDSENGTATVDADGFIRFVPDADFAGDAFFTYSVLDEDGELREFTVTVGVINENDRPDAVDDVVQLDEDQSYNLNELLLNDTDIDGDALSFFAISSVSVGSITIDANGNPIFQPPANFVGEVEVTYIVQDGSGESDANAVARARLIFTEAENDAPVLQAVTLDGAVEDTAFNFTEADVLAGAEDPEGEAVSLQSIELANPNLGTVQFDQSTGQITVQPALNVNGEVVLNTVLADASGNTRTGTLSINVQTVEDDLASSTQDVEINGDASTVFEASNLLSNVPNPANETLSITAVRVADGNVGRVRLINNAQQVDFEPAPGFEGSTAFEIRVSNGADQFTQTVAVTVTEPVPIPEPIMDTPESMMDAPDAMMDPGTDAMMSPTTNPVTDSMGSTTGADTETSGDTPVAQSIEQSAPQVPEAPEPTPLPGFLLSGQIEDTPGVFTQTELLSNLADTDIVSIDTVRFADPDQGTVEFDANLDTFTLNVSENFFGDLELVIEGQTANNEPITLTGTVQVAAVDDPFEVVDVAGFELLEDEEQIFTRADLLAEFVPTDFTDVDGEELVITAVRTLDENAGQVTLNDEGDVVFTPTPEVSGPAAFEFDVTDGNTTVTARADINIIAVDDAPVTEADRLEGVVEEQVFSFTATDLLANDADPEGTELSLLSITLTNPDQGTLELNTDTGDATFTPAENVFGEIDFSYLVSDATGNVSTGTGVIAVSNVDDDFEVRESDFRNPTFNLVEDEVRTFTRADLLPEFADSGFTDVDDETLTFSAVRVLDPALGSASIIDGTQIKLTPAANITGEVSIEVDVTDGVNTNTLTTTVRVFPSNDAPTLQVDAASVGEDGELVVNVADLLANDSDVEGSPLRVVGVFDQSNGTTEFNAETGELIYRPNENYNGDSIIEYLVEDEQGAFSLARFDITVNAQGDEIDARDDALRTSEDTGFTVQATELLANDENVDGDTLRIVSIDTSSITNGTLTLSSDGQSLTYTAEQDFNGTQTFTYTAEDPDGNQSTATATIEVTPSNDAPVVIRALTTTEEDTDLVLTAAELLANASDIEDDWLSVESVRVSEGTNFGTVSLNEFTGEVTFTPNENYNSDAGRPDVALEYLVVDQNGAQAWATIDINVSPVNDPPVAVNDLVLGFRAGPNGFVNQIDASALLVNDQLEEVDGDTLVVTAVGNSQTGNVSLANNVISFSSLAETDTFTYTLSDGIETTTGTVQVQLIENTPPEVFDVAAQGTEDNVQIFNIEDFIDNNVRDVDTGNQDLQEILDIESVGNAQFGTVELVNGEIRFTPDANFNSSNGQNASFEYTVTDVVGNTAMASVSINLAEQNDPVIAVNDIFDNSIREDTGRLVFSAAELLENDIDVDDDAVITGFSSNNGSIRSLGGDQFEFAPSANFFGNAVINYTLSDGENSDSGAAIVNVTPVNDPPVIVASSSAMGNEGEENSIDNLLTPAFVRDIDSSSLRLEIVGQPTNGINARVVGNSIVWSDDSPGTGVINYRVIDSGGASSQVSRIDVTTLDVNGPPTISGLNAEVNDGFIGPLIRGNSLVIDGQIFANDPDGDDLVFSANVSATVNTNNLRIDVDAFTGSFEIRGGVSSGDLATGAIDIQTFVEDGNENITSSNFRLTFSDTFSTTTVTRLAAPVVIDLNNDGFSFTELSPMAEATARFDFDSDGVRERTAFIAGDGDGILALDLEGDGIIERADEISFVSYLEGAQTDLEGLVAFDTDGDGFLSANDDDFNRFGIWVDDGDGESEEGEFRTLAAAGIESINLQSDEQERIKANGDVIVHGITEVILEGGTVIEGVDASFRFQDDIGFLATPLDDTEPDTVEISNEATPTGDFIGVGSVENDLAEQEITDQQSEQANLSESDDAGINDIDDEAAQTEELADSNTDTQDTELSTADVTDLTEEQVEDSSAQSEGEVEDETQVVSDESEEETSESEELAGEADPAEPEDEQNDELNMLDDLPTDEELDQMAAQAASDAAAMADETPVAEVSSDPEASTMDSSTTEDAMSMTGG